MKKSSRLTAVFLSAVLLISAICGIAPSAEEDGGASQSASLAPYYTIVNRCEDITGVKTNVAPAPGSNSPDGKSIIIKSSQNLNKIYVDQNYYEVTFSNINVPENAEALVFWYGQSFEERNANSFISTAKSNSDAILRPKFDVRAKAAGSTGDFSENKDQNEIYMVSSDDGTVYSAKMGNSVTGTIETGKYWGSVENGYVVLPRAFFKTETFNESKIDLRIRVLGTGSQYIDKDGNVITTVDKYGKVTKPNKISANTCISFDNIGFITDMEAFKTDCGTKGAKNETFGRFTYTNSAVANKLCPLSGGKSLNETVEVKSSAAAVKWDGVENAAKYRLTLYNKVFAAVSEKEVTENEAELEIPAGRYILQIAALDESGVVTASSLQSVAINSDINSTGETDICDLVYISLDENKEKYETDLDGDGACTESDAAYLRNLLLEIK